MCAFGKAKFALVLHGAAASQNPGERRYTVRYYKLARQEIVLDEVLSVTE